MSSMKMDGWIISFVKKGGLLGFSRCRKAVGVW